MYIGLTSVASFTPRAIRRASGYLPVCHSSEPTPLPSARRAHNQMPRAASKPAGIESAKADFKAAAEAANRAVELLNKQAAAPDPEQQKQAAANKYFALNSRAEAMRLFVTKVDATQADAAATAFQEYMAVE